MYVGVLKEHITSVSLYRILVVFEVIIFKDLLRNLLTEVFAEVYLGIGGGDRDLTPHCHWQQSKELPFLLGNSIWGLLKGISG